MKILLVCDTFFPASNSAANQLLDLAIQLDIYGHELTVITPKLIDSDILVHSKLKNSKIQISYVKMPLNKDISNFKRAINEILIPFRFFVHYYKKKLNKVNFDSIIWYSPTIFFGIFIKFIKKDKNTYLILRDLFPKWAYEAGVIRNKIIYNFFKKIEFIQYQVADTIGVQSKGNISHFEKTRFLGKIKILNNWVLHDFSKKKHVKIRDSKISFVFLGNIGIAQDLKSLIQIVEHLLTNEKYDVTFIGRGTHFGLLKKKFNSANKKIKFLDEMPNEKISQIIDNYHIGIISLDQTLSTNNIPGKFITYTTNGLPVVAYTRANGDLANYINVNQLGITFNSFEKFNDKIDGLIENYEIISQNCIEFSKKNFDVKIITNEIITCLQI
jgi:hypothetical protein